MFLFFCSIVFVVAAISAIYYEILSGIPEFPQSKTEGNKQGTKQNWIILSGFPF